MVFILIISLANVVSFADSECKEEASRYTYISTFDGTISHGLISTSVKVEVTGKSSVTKIKVKMELQKLSDGSYSTVETWEQTFYSSEALMEESKLTNPFSTYRLKATVTAYSGSNSESQTFYKY